MIKLANERMGDIADIFSTAGERALMRGAADVDVCRLAAFEDGAMFAFVLKIEAVSETPPHLWEPREETTGCNDDSMSEPSESEFSLLAFRFQATDIKWKLEKARTFSIPASPDGYRKER